MCELSEKLIAWLDHELADDEMAQVQRHIQDCNECRCQLHAYQQVSRKFDAYLDAVVASKAERRMPRWVPVLSIAAVGALAAVAFLVFLRPRVEPLAPVSSVKTAPAASVLGPKTAPVPVPIRKVRQRHAPSPPPEKNQVASWPPSEPAIQIAIPAESMFPPGAIPEGVNFTADLSIAADGSAQQIRLRPRLVGFERRATQP
ncbi:MAG TPA: zf-HC2 domain-containing protein [Candidatus Acidoferrum sp.]|jgi:anti-sigma factor RsiW